MKILLLVTDEPFPEAAVAMSGLLARLTQSSVTILYVTSNGQDAGAGQAALDRAQEMLAPLSVQLQQRLGRPTGRLITETRDEGYDFVVLEMREIGHLNRLLTGSRTRSVIRGARTSVLVVKRPRPELKRLLICTSGVKTAETVIQAGARLARIAEAQATLLHVAGSVPSMYTGLSALDETLSKLLDSDTPLARHLRRGAEILAQNQVPAELELRHGVVAAEILREASGGDYDLIVVGAPRPASPLQAWLLGDVAWEVVARAERPVLVVKYGPLRE